MHEENLYAGVARYSNNPAIEKPARQCNSVADFSMQLKAEFQNASTCRGGRSDIPIYIMLTGWGRETHCCTDGFCDFAQNDAE
jgi:hypothetical protein